MLDMLFKFIFELITKLADIITAPLINGLFALFPFLPTYTNLISAYLDYALRYVPIVREFSLIPLGALTMLLDYYIIKYSIYLFKIAFNFIVNIYNKFKP